MEHVVSKLIDYGTIKEKNPHVEKLIGLAKQYSADFEETKIPATKITVDNSVKDALKQLADLLSKNEKIEDLQNSIYSIGKKIRFSRKTFSKFSTKLFSQQIVDQKLDHLLKILERRKLQILFLNIFDHYGA